MSGDEKENIRDNPKSYVAWKEEAERLQGFVDELFELADWPDGGDIDAIEFQDIAIKYGVLVPEKRTSPCSYEEGMCACREYYSEEEWKAGITCYRKRNDQVENL